MDNSYPITMFKRIILFGHKELSFKPNIMASLKHVPFALKFLTFVPECLLFHLKKK